VPDWSALHPIRGDQRYAFEELAYQIAKVLFGDQGHFVRVDDSGGGDGVEFYLRRFDGSEWGWQAKFFPEGRLTASRKNQIVGSLRRACDVHPNLQQWTLCVPLNLTVSERNWFDRHLSQAVPDGSQVAIHLWSDSDFSAWLAEPRFAGRRRFFFGELELDLDWFKSQFDKQAASLKDRFNPNLHVETQIDDAVHNLLGDDHFVEEVDRELRMIDQAIDELEDAIVELEEAPFPGLQWGTARDELSASARQLLQAVTESRTRMGEARAALATRNFSAIRDIDLDSAVQDLDAQCDSYLADAEIRSPYSMAYGGDASRQSSITWRAYKAVQEPANVAELLRSDLIAIRMQIAFLDEAELHVFGAAGVGKSHLACHICEQRLQAGLPAIFLRGARFRSDQPLEVQLRELLDVPPSYSWGDFLQVLATVAETYETRIPIIVDGLNEAVREGRFSAVWETDLPGVAMEVARAGGLAIITTCRPTYRRAIWGAADPSNHIVLAGFDDEDLEYGIEKYFDWYKIVADTPLVALSSLRLPIYLRMFCEITNPDRQVVVQAHVGQQALFDVFDEYLARSNEAVSRALNRLPEAGVAHRALKRLGEFLWMNNSRIVSLEDASRVIDERPLAEVDLRQSIAQQLLNEGLVLEREMSEGEEVIQFAYDILGGYLIASHLLEANGNDLETFLQSAETTDKLFGDDVSRRHPLADDIGRGIAASLPRIGGGTHLYEIVDSPWARQLSLAALFEIAAEFVNQRATEFVERLFENEGDRRRILRLAASTVAQVGHPLNADFWSARLKTLAIAERDLTWTEHVRSNLESFERLAEQLEDRCRDAGLSPAAHDRAHLVAAWLRWGLTSTTPFLRDAVTRALYYYGRRWPTQFSALLRDSLSVDDPYVSERMLAAAYGVAMAQQRDDGDACTSLARIVEVVFACMFAPDAPNSTTHYLARDYAWRTVDLINTLCPGRLTDSEAELARPPFLSDAIRMWGKSEDLGRGRYRNGTHPLARNHGGPVEEPQRSWGAACRDPRSPEFRGLLSNLWWRIHGFGYSVDRFGDVDAAIVLQRPSVGWAREKWLTHPYGRKYALIAALELAGSLDDGGRLRFDPEETPEADRPSFVDLDPSFPSEANQCSFVQIDLLGDRQLPPEEWVKARHDPDVRGYDILDVVCDEAGPWVLLAGHLVQQEHETRRDMFFYTTAFIASTNSYSDSFVPRGGVVQLATTFPRTHYTFAGEIPWSATYPPNPRENVSPRGNAKDLQGFLAVTKHDWEGYHSQLNPSVLVFTPAKQIAQALDLVGRPQSFDLYERDGRRASISLQPLAGTSKYPQALTYLRADLADRYLRETGSTLLWMTWGERQVLAADGSLGHQSRFRAFQSIITYEP
jgi:hypothetical protein